MLLVVIIDQLIDQAIAPRLLGSFTGLRPIWVIISLLLGTYVGGILGLLIAVPFAGFIKDTVDNAQLVISGSAHETVKAEDAPEILAKKASEQ